MVLSENRPDLTVLAKRYVAVICTTLVEIGSFFFSHSLASRSASSAVEAVKVLTWSIVSLSKLSAASRVGTFRRVSGRLA
jgi:hypothetical protein